MRRLRSQKALTLICVGIVVFAACVPFVATIFTAILTPLWLVVPAVVVVLIRRRATRCDEQPASLVSVLLSRAPPALIELA